MDIKTVQANIGVPNLTVTALAQTAAHFPFLRNPDIFFWFFEVSIPKYGEAPISVSGIGDNFVDLTIRRVGKVTNEVFEHYVGDTLLLRGPTLSSLI